MDLLLLHNMCIVHMKRFCEFQPQHFTPLRVIQLLVR
jgi:hypothetical protein